MEDDSQLNILPKGLDPDRQTDPGIFTHLFNITKLFFLTSSFISQGIIHGS